MLLSVGLQRGGCDLLTEQQKHSERNSVLECKTKCTKISLKSFMSKMLTYGILRAGLLAFWKTMLAKRRLGDPEYNLGLSNVTNVSICHKDHTYKRFHGLRN